MKHPETVRRRKRQEAQRLSRSVWYTGSISRWEGVLVFAKTKKAAAGLSKQVTDGTMKKTYQAVCCVTEKGRRWLENAEEWHALTDYLVKDARTNTSSVTEKGRKEAKEARLSFRIVARCGSWRLQRLHLIREGTIRSGCRWHMRGFHCMGM